MKDLHSTWGHRWITPKAEPRDSKIQGTGMFARESIAQDEVVAMYGGIIVPKADIEKYRELIGGIRGIQVEEDFYICPTETAGGLFNHSCEPTLGYGGQITIVAVRNIEADEELAFEYAFSETNFESFTCTCGNKTCRHTIKPTDWQNPELRGKWGKYFTPLLRSKFKY